MIEDYRTDGVSDKLKQYFFESGQHDHVSRVMWKEFRPIVAQAIIGLKKGLIPFCERNGFVSNNLDNCYNPNGDKVEAKHYNFFKFDNKKHEELSVYVQMRYKHLTVFVNIDLTKLHENKVTKIWGNKTKTTSSGTELPHYYNDFLATQHSICRWSDFSEMYDKIVSYEHTLGTNLTKEEFGVLCNECLVNNNFVVFEMTFDDSDIDEETENDEMLPYLEKVIDYIASSKESYHGIWNEYCTGINELPLSKNIKTRTLISTSSENCELDYNWDSSLFDLMIDFKYTERNETS